MKINLIYDETNGKIMGYDSFESNESKQIDVNGDLLPYKIFDYKYVDGQFIKLTEEEKEEFYPQSSGDDDITKKIKNTLNDVVLNVIPDGETLTPENVPSLVDIINPATTEESGTQTNPIVVVDNDIAHNGYLYTYGKYYKWNGVLYQCKRTGESGGGMIKLFYTPDKLIGHYFVTV